VVALIFGGLILTSGNPSGFQVNRWLVIGLSSAIGMFILFVVTSIIRIRRQPATMGVQTLLGKEAVARSHLNPDGMVFVEGEYWSATVEEGKVKKGEKVVVTGVDGLKLMVSKEKGAGDGEG
jgi:membrane-bound serine protease (ClpP class)